VSFTILVLLPNPDVVTAVNGVMAAAFSSILFNFFYRNLRSKCVIKPYRKYYSRLVNGLGI